MLALLTACLTVQATSRVCAVPPERIVTISPSGAEVICLLGACDRIVGVDDFCVYPAELTKRVRVGGLFNPDLERIVGLQPDLIVLRGKHPAIAELCRRLGISLYEDPTERLEDIPRCVRELGRLLGLEDRAEAVVARFEADVAEIRKRTAGRKRPRVLLTVSRPPDRLDDILTTGPGTFLHEMLELAGGTNVFGHLETPWPQVNAESILASRPEVILEFQPELKLTEAIQEQMRSQWRKLGSVPAARKDRIYLIMDENCLIPSPRVMQVVDRISRLLHSSVSRD